MPSRTTTINHRTHATVEGRLRIEMAECGDANFESIVGSSIVAGCSRPDRGMNTIRQRQEEL
jgi:hypothetical protein